jgi:hypothetical protein
MIKPLIALTFASVLTIHGAATQPPQPTEAGEGNYEKFWFPSTNNARNKKFERFNSYIRVSVVSWFVNKQSSYWTDRMASGTCEVTVGEEPYSIALGTFALDEGAYTAPIFDKVIVDNRLWVSGDLGIKVFLKANQSDTVLATVLKDMAQSSLGVASSSAATYGTQLASGPYAPLAAAGKTLITSVQNILSSGKKPLPIFDLGGLDFTTALSLLEGEVNYVLLLRGNRSVVTKDKLAIVESGPNVRVLFNNNQLTDGAWMLLRVANETTYGKVRPWEEPSNALRLEIANLMGKVTNGLVSKIDALTLLLPTPVGTQPSATGTKTKTLGDRVQELESQITNDTLLSVNERSSEDGKNTAVWYAAISACRADKPNNFAASVKSLENALKAGSVPEDPTMSHAFRSAAKSVTSTLPNTIAPKISSDADLWKNNGEIQTKRSLQGKKLLW